MESGELLICRSNGLIEFSTEGFRTNLRAGRRAGVTPAHRMVDLSFLATILELEL